MERRGSQVFFDQAEQDEFGVGAVLEAEDAFKFAGAMMESANKVYGLTNSQRRDLNLMPERPRAMWTFAIETVDLCMDVAERVAEQNRNKHIHGNPEA